MEHEKALTANLPDTYGQLFAYAFKEYKAANAEAYLQYRFETHLQHRLAEHGLPHDFTSLIYDHHSDISGVYACVRRVPIPPVMTTQGVPVVGAGVIYLNKGTADVIGRYAESVVDHELGHTFSLAQNHPGEYAADYHAARMNGGTYETTQALKILGEHHPDTKIDSDTHPSMPKRIDAIMRDAPLIRLANIGRDVDAHAGRAVSRAAGVREIAKALQYGMNGNQDEALAHTAGAAISLTGEVLQNKRVMEKAAIYAPVDILKMTTGTIQIAGKKVPILGAVLAVGFGTYEVGVEAKHAYEGSSSWKRVGATWLANVGEVGGGVFGFGIGEIARQGIVEASAHVLGKAHAPNDAVSVGLIKEGWSLATEAVNKMKEDNTVKTKFTVTPLHTPAVQGTNALLHAKSVIQPAVKILGEGGNSPLIHVPAATPRKMEVASNHLK